MKNRDENTAVQVDIVPMPIGWQCEHMNITSGPINGGSVRAWCGCDMKPVRE